MASTSDSGSGKERRRHPRYRVRKSTRTRSASQEHRGEVKDISASGAAIEPKAGMQQGAPVEVDIEDFGVFSARVTRVPEDDVFAVEFDLGEEEEERLIAELTHLNENIDSEDI